MTQSDLLAIESELQTKLPKVFRTFMLNHGEEIRQAEKTLRYEVVLKTDPKEVVELNLEVRHFGIETEPWPLEYLALSDNGAGDHECIKLSDATGAIYRFYHERGGFCRKYKSLKDYLGNLEKRMEKFGKSGAGKSDPELLDALTLLSGEHAFLAVLKRVKSPATLESLRAAGINPDRLKSGLAQVLELITGIAAGKWRMVIGAGDYPVQLKVSYSTNAKLVRPLALSSIHMGDGELTVGFKALDPKVPPSNPPIDWLALENALCGLHKTVIGKPVRLSLGKISGEFNEYGYGSYECEYCLVGSGGLPPRKRGGLHH
jgi:hypothetical protein